METDVLIRAYRFNLVFAADLVSDVEDSQMTQAAGPGLVNHPAWTLGHLCSGAALTIKYLEGTRELPNGWDALFKRKGPGDPRNPELNVEYPSKAELLSELTSCHEIVESLIAGVSREKWVSAREWRFSKYMGTYADVVHFMCVTHEMMHLNQLSAWRRAMGLPSSLARL